MNRWTVYFWEPCLSPHKLALFRALLAQPDVHGCVYVTQEALLKDRVAEGWEVDATDDLDVRIAPSDAEVADIIAHAPANTIHLFSGIHWVPCIVAGIRESVRQKARFAIMTEPRVREGLKGLARLLHSWATERAVRRNAAFVLAIGRNGPPWFRRAGYRKIFPFAYYLPIRRATALYSAKTMPRIGYLGRINEAKGIRLFLEAIKTLTLPVQIEIAGLGPDAPRVQAASDASNGEIRFHGAIPMSSVPDFLAAIDVLVVPSITTDDGWGAVVSEALIAGAAVVATSQVGASICLDEAWRGEVVRSLDPGHVAAAITRVARRPANSAARDRRSAWAESHLSGEAGAEYLLQVLTHVFDGAPKPIPFYENPALGMSK